MTESIWNDVDEFFAERIRPQDTSLAAALRDGKAAGLPQIQVSALQAGFLEVLARTVRARRILEIGTLFGYSTIHLARALPDDGRLVTLEHSPAHAEVARRNLERAGLGGVAEIRVGAALDTLPGVSHDADRPFDLVFIDADKENNPEYLEWALKLTRSGGVIVVDNVVRGGSVADLSDTSPGVVGTRRMLDLVAASDRLDASVLQTVGSKGYDGFLIASVR